MFSLFPCLLLPSPFSLLALNFKTAFSLQRIYRGHVLPCDDLQTVVEFDVLLFTVLPHLHEKSLSVECCLETKKVRHDVKLLYDAMADTRHTSTDEQCTSNRRVKGIKV